MSRENPFEKPVLHCCAAAASGGLERLLRLKSQQLSATYVFRRSRRYASYNNSHLPTRLPHELGPTNTLRVTRTPRLDMVFYSLHVFDRSGRCLFDREWNGPKRDDGSGEHPRLVFGMLHSLGEMAGKLAPAGRAPDGHLSIRTDNYALHTFEALSGYRFALLADDDSNINAQAVLFHVYAQLWVECVVKSPVQDPTSGARVGSPLFVQQLDKYVGELLKT